ACTPGQRYQVSLDSWTTDSERANGYPSLSQRKASRSVKPHLVIFEMSNARGIPVSPLSSATTASYVNGDEVLSSGVFEVVSTSTITEQLSRMDQNGVTANQYPAHAITKVIIGQISRGLDDAVTPQA